MNNRFRGIDYRLTEKGYDPDNMPSVNTPEYDAMRFDVAYYNWRLEQPYLMQYYDGQNKQVVMRSHCCYMVRMDDIDISPTAIEKRG